MQKNVDSHCVSSNARILHQKNARTQGHNTRYRDESGLVCVSNVLIEGEKFAVRKIVPSVPFANRLTTPRRWPRAARESRRYRRRVADLRILHDAVAARALADQLNGGIQCLYAIDGAFHNSLHHDVLLPICRACREYMMIQEARKDQKQVRSHCYCVQLSVHA